MITALSEYLEQPEIIVIRGTAAEAGEWSRTIGALYAPQRLIFAVPDDATDLPGALATRAAADNTIAYVCKGNECGLPLASLEELLAAIRET